VLGGSFLSSRLSGEARLRWLPDTQSGGAVLAPAAFVFVAGMFTGGIATALLWYRGRRNV
jgi:hypothetical protein